MRTTYTFTPIRS